MFTFKIFIFSIALFFSIGSESQRKQMQSLSKKNYSLEDQTLSKRELSGRQSPRVLGIVLKFDRQPNEEEIHAIIQYAESNGLEKTEELYYEKAWIFQWKTGDLEEKSLIETYLICNGFPKTSSIRYCVPNHEPIPADLVIKGNPSCAIASLSHTSNECYSDGILSCRFRNSNSMRKLAGGYNWAQQKIGSDLFREEFLDRLKNHTPPSILVFDTPKNSHDIKVQNLISGNFDQAILPQIQLQYSSASFSDRLSLLNNLKKKTTVIRVEIHDSDQAMIIIAS